MMVMKLLRSNEEGSDMLFFRISFVGLSELIRTHSSGRIVVNAQKMRSANLIILKNKALGLLSLIVDDIAGLLNRFPSARIPVSEQR